MSLADAPTPEQNSASRDGTAVQQPRRRSLVIPNLCCVALIPLSITALLFWHPNLIGNATVVDPGEELRLYDGIASMNFNLLRPQVESLCVAYLDVPDRLVHGESPHAQYAQPLVKWSDGTFTTEQYAAGGMPSALRRHAVTGSADRRPGER